MKKSGRFRLFGSLAVCMGLAAGAAWTVLAGAPSFAFDAKTCRIPERFRNHPLFTEPVMGMNFGFGGRRGYYAAHMDEPVRMKAAGVNWCVLKIHPMQEEFCSRKIFFDPVFTVGEQETAEMVAKLHEQGIRVMLQPCVMALDSTAMANSFGFPSETDCQLEGRHPKYWRAWFDSMRECLEAVADFSERNGVEALIIGCEYNRTSHRAADWREILAAVRRRYSGPVSYENGLAVESDGPGWGEWLADLDFLCFSYYPPVRPMPPEDFVSAEQWNALPDVPREEMVKALSGQALKRLDQIVKLSRGLPLVLTEVGMTSLHGWCRRPWDGMWPHEKGVRRDYREQANYLGAVFETFASRPYCAGFCVWKWDESQPRWMRDPDPMKDGGFQIMGKPAGEVFRTWAAAARAGRAIPANAGRPIRVACIGDSITWGAAMTNRVAECYPAQLQRLLGEGYEVRNFGDPGSGVYTVPKAGPSGWRSHPWRAGQQARAAYAFEPDIVVSNLGINDNEVFLFEYTPDETGTPQTRPGLFRDEYVDLLRAFARDGRMPRVIMWTRLGPLSKKHPGKGRPNPFVMEHALREVATVIGAETLDMHAPLMPYAETAHFASDGVHPEGGAQRAIAEITARRIRAE